jgi:polar amino acid transport system substrate-binding protein
MKRIFALVITLIMMLSLASCTSDAGNAGGAGGDATRGTLVCGVTIFEPMNFRDDAGNWAGFDTEFALAVGEILNMDVEFQLIEWINKFIELDSGAIDAIWNGFTATANEPDGTPRIDLCDMSYSYLLNTQAIVVRAETAWEFAAEADLIGRNIAVEAGSAGESKARNLAGETGNIIGVPKQINTFIEVKSGAADAAIVDIILANEIVGQGDFDDLGISSIDLGSEVYAIGFRKGDTLRDEVNAAIVQLYENGTLLEIATKWGLEDRLVIDRSWGQW